MTLRKRSLLYLIRKRGRSILFLLFLFTIACILQVGGSLKSNADQEEKELRESLGSGFILKADTENESYYELRSKKGHAYNLYTGPRVTDEVINQILKIPGVIDYEVSFLDFVWTDLSLKAGAWAADMEPDEYFTKEQLELFSQKTRIYPCRKGEQNKNFWTGAFKISKGRNIQEGDHHKAVISEWLAKKNGLTIGDTFMVESKEGLLWGSKEPFNTLGLPIELEIVGLFQPNFQQEESDATYEDGYVVNQIFTDLNTHASLQKNIGEEDKGLGYTEVTFFVKDPAKLESIMQQIRENEQIDIEGMIFKADDAAYQASVKPFHLISLFSASIIVIGLIGIGIILYLVVKFWIKGRMREVGIYLSIGIGKERLSDRCYWNVS